MKLFVTFIAIGAVVVSTSDAVTMNDFPIETQELYNVLLNDPYAYQDVMGIVADIMQTAESLKEFRKLTPPGIGDEGSFFAFPDHISSWFCDYFGWCGYGGREFDVQDAEILLTDSKYMTEDICDRLGNFYHDHDLQSALEQNNHSI